MLHSWPIFVLLLASFFFRAYPQIDTQQPETSNSARLAIEKEVSGSLGLSTGTLFLTRREDLEVELHGLLFIANAPSLKPGDKIRVGCIQIFDIKREGYKIEQGFIVGGAVDLDDAPLWRVAYDCVSKKAYHLYGFSDDEAGFGNLIKDMGLRVQTDSLALVATSSFIKLTYPEAFEVEIRDELGLMAAAISEFQGRRSWKSFNAFWAKCPGSVKRQISPPSVTLLGDVYKVTFFVYGKRRIIKTSIRFSFDGEFSLAESNQLFAW